jgi:hypothetical protein
MAQVIRQLALDLSSSYKPLSLEKSQIRLLTLIPTEFEEMALQCMLVAVPLPRAYRK